MFCFSLVWFWTFVMEAHVAKTGPKTTLNFWPGCHHLSSARIIGSGFTFSVLFCFPETGSEVSQVDQKPSMEPRMTSELLTIFSTPPPELQACSTHQVYEMLGTEVMVSCKIGKYSTNRAKSATLISLAFSRFNFTIFICVCMWYVCVPTCWCRGGQMRASDPLELVLQAERSANIQTWVPCKNSKCS